MTLSDDNKRDILLNGMILSGTHCIYLTQIVPGTKRALWGSASRGKPVLICRLARSLGFHAVTPERSENRTYFSTFIMRRGSCMPRLRVRNLS